MDKLQPYRDFPYAKWSILIANINKFLIRNTSRGRSSRLQMIFKVDVLKYFAIFTGKYLCWSLFLITLQASGLKVCNFIRKRLTHRCFLVVNIVKFLRTAFIEHLWWLLLKMSYWTPPQGFFKFKWMFMNFSNFLLWEVYPSMVIDGQYIFITYLWLSWQGKNLQQLKTWNLQHHEIIVVNLYTWSVFISHVACFGKTSNSW